MPVCYMLVGLSGSGKSTKTSSLLKDVNAVVLSTDNYIEDVAKKSNKTYNEVFQDEIKNAEKHLHNQLNYAVKNGLDVIYDQTNLTPKDRKRKLNKFPDTYKKIAIIVQCDIGTVLSRNEDRKKYGRGIPPYVIEMQLDSFSYPTLEEGFDEICLV